MVNNDTVIRNHSQLKIFRNSKCAKCKKSFAINNTIHTVTNSRNGRKRYHKKCWIDKHIWREINYILKLHQFAWLSNGKDSCWLKLIS